jgi:LSD1 subclass zinc finger protein
MLPVGLYVAVFDAYPNSVRAGEIENGVYIVRLIFILMVSPTQILIAFLSPQMPLIMLCRATDVRCALCGGISHQLVFAA